MKIYDEYTFGSEKFVKLEDYEDSEKDLRLRISNILEQMSEVIAQNERFKSALNVAMPHVKTCYKQHWAKYQDLEIIKDALLEPPVGAIATVRAEAFENGYLDGWNDFEGGKWKCALRSEAFLDIFRGKMK